MYFHETRKEVSLYRLRHLSRITRLRSKRQCTFKDVRINQIKLRTKLGNGIQYIKIENERRKENNLNPWKCAISSCCAIKMTK